MKTRRSVAVAALLLAWVLPSLAAGSDEGDDEYRFLAGLAEKGMHGMVVDEAKVFLRDHAAHPKADLARYRLASALFELDRRGEAAPHLERLAALGGFEYAPEAWFLLGQCQIEMGRYGDARRSLERVLESDRKYLFDHARFLQADCAFRSGDFETAEVLYARVLRDDPRGDYARDAAFGLCWCAWKRGKVRAAIQGIEEFLRRYPEAEEDGSGDELRILLGEAHLQSGAARKALEAFRSIREGPRQEAALRGVGFALARLGDHRGAAEAFGTLRERFPDGPFAGEATLHHGIHLLRCGRAREAAEVLSSAGAGDGAEALYWRSQAQAKAGDARAALRSLDRALASELDGPMAARIQAARGDLLFEDGREEEALQAYARAGSDYALHAGAVTALNGGEEGEAIRLASELIERYPESDYLAATRIVLGEAHFARGDYAEAERTLTPVVGGVGGAEGADDPAQRARALSRLAWCRYLQGDAAGAARVFGRVVREHPRAAEAEEALFMQGRAHEEAGDTAAAVSAWSSHLRQHPRGEHRAGVLAGLARNEDIDRATSRIQGLLEESAGSALLPEALFELAERSSRAGSLENAEACYRRLLQGFPEHPRATAARYGLGWCLVERQEYGEAARHLGAVPGDPGASPELRIFALELLLWAQRRAGNPQGALDAFRSLARLCDDDRRLFDAARTTATALGEADRVGEAQELLDDLLDRVKSPDVAVAILVEGTYLALENGDVDRAEAHVRVARRRAPRHAAVAEASFFVGEARLEAGDLERSVELYRAATGDDSPLRATALYKLGFVELRRENPEQALAPLTRVVGDHRQSELWGEALFLLGEAQFRLGRWEEAAASLQRLRKEAPRHEVLPRALFRLGVALGRLERWSRAEDALADLAKGFPGFENATEAKLWRGRSLAHLGRGRAARQALQRVVSDDRGVLAARARIELGKLSLAEGDTEEALSQFLKVALLYAADDEVAESLYRAGLCLEALDDRDHAIEQYREVVVSHRESAFADEARARLGELERDTRARDGESRGPGGKDGHR